MSYYYSKIIEKAAKQALWGQSTPLPLCEGTTLPLGLYLNISDLLKKKE